MIRSATDLRAYLSQQLLPLWADKGRDKERGGWHILLAPDLSPSGDATFRRLVVHARQLYAMSVAHELGTGPLAKHAIDASLDELDRWFRDPVHGGWYFTLELDGSPRDRRKDTYAHATLLFALAYCHGATQAPLALTYADHTQAMIEEHLLRSAEGGYRDFASEDWQAIEDGEHRRQNSHMHMLEALLALYQTTGRPEVLNRAKSIVSLFREHFFHSPSGTLAEHFAADWSPATDPELQWVEPGHHFEWVWLLNRYADISGDRSGLEAAETLYKTAMKHGLVSGGLAVIDQMSRNGSKSKTDQRVWPQTEFIKALVARWEFHEDEEARRRLFDVLDFCERKRINPETGAWYERLDVDSVVVDPSHTAAGVYHIVLALTEVLRVLEREGLASQRSKEP